MDERAVGADDRRGALRGEGGHVLVAGHEGGHDLLHGGLREVRELLVGEERHRRHPLGQALSLHRVVQAPRLGENEAVVPGLLDDLRCPDHPAARVIASQDRHDGPVVRPHVLEPAKDPGRDIEEVAFLKDHLAGRPPAPPEEPPAAPVHEEDLRGAVGVGRVDAVRRLARRADVEADLLPEVHVLVRALRDAHPDDAEVLLAVRARRVAVDERAPARLEIAVADDAGFHLDWGHRSFRWPCRCPWFPVRSVSGSLSGSRPPRGARGREAAEGGEAGRDGRLARERERLTGSSACIRAIIEQRRVGVPAAARPPGQTGRSPSTDTRCITRRWPW